jgi:hypothetical protein
MKKFDIFLLAWCPFFVIFELVRIMMEGFTLFRLTAFIINLICLIMVFSENEAYLKEKFKTHILKRLQ